MAIYATDFRQITDQLNAEALRFCMQFLPNGARKGDFWCSADILDSHRGGDSFVVYLKGNKSGFWVENGEPAVVEGKYGGKQGFLVNIIMAQRKMTYVQAVKFANGKKGGRPKTQRKPSGNPAVTQRKPSGNPAETQREPSGNPAETQQEPSGNPAVTQRKPSGNPAVTQREPSGNPAVTQQEPSGNPENAPSGKKKERTKERKNINISPLYSPLKDGQAQNASQTDSKNKAEIKKLSIMAECLNSFKGNFENSNLNISSSDKINIFNAFEEWLKFRFFTIEKPLKPQTAIFHSKRAVKCLVEDFLSPSQLIELFRKSIENEWQGWYFKENVLKLKAFNENSKFQKNPAPLGVPSGAWESDDDDFVY